MLNSMTRRKNVLVVYFGAFKRLPVSSSLRD